MRTRYHHLERQYRRRMALCYPLAALFGVILLVSAPPLAPPPRSRELTVGQTGVLTILPEVDIIPDEVSQRRLTAAPRTSAPSDFEVIELDYVDLPSAEPVPAPSLAQEPAREIPREEPVIPEVQTAVRTTGHPVLARTDVELIHLERPVYPAEAIQLGIEGLVEIVILVDTTGRVAQAHVVNPNRVPVLEKAARDAVQKTVFRIYRIDGKPTAFWVRVPYEFRLVSGE